MKKLIALDAGHGMDTGGKRTPLFDNGTFMHEHEFNRAVVLEMNALLKQRGFDVLLITAGDDDTPLGVRTGLANNTLYNGFSRPADFYLSVHANADKGVWGAANGVETYVYPMCTPGSTTYKYGEIIHKHLVKATKRRDRGLKTDNFHVLRETKMPAVLVECGFMDNREEAELLKSYSYRMNCAFELTDAICEIFAETSANEISGLTPIMGMSDITAGQMVEYLNSKNPEPLLPNCTALELAIIFIFEALAEGVRHDFLWAQTCKETGFFKYGGIVTSDMNNYAGIGALDNNAKGNAASFKSPVVGVRAQVQHAKAYASVEKLVGECVDPRFHLVQRGCAVYVEHLGQKENPLGKGWATAENYGISIVNDYMKQLSAVKTDGASKFEPPQHEPLQYQTAALQGLVDAGFIVSPEYWNDLDAPASKGDLLAIAHRLYLFLNLATKGASV